MVSKTRDRFIEVARQLFARKGVENTTMNDIASASDKGRRTIYTYFKSKKDIFNAVVESESDNLLRRLRLVLMNAVSPEEKIEGFISCRLEAMSELTPKGPHRGSFLRDMRKHPKGKKEVSVEEISIFEDILREGIKQGVFEIDDVHRLAVVTTHAIYGFGMSTVHDNIVEEGITLSQLKTTLSVMILNGLRTR